MEDHKVKKGRPLKYHTEEERKLAITKSKTAYMHNKEWMCLICNPTKKYSLGGKTQHLKINKHQRNVMN